MSSQVQPQAAGHSDGGAARALSFEEALARLEQIVSRIETGDAGLEESLRLFEEGVALARLCRAQLDRAEARIRVLVEGPGGELVEQPFVTPQAEAAGKEEDA